ncbi:hypothetical protein [Spirillospora sp. CA-294931]|uniref:hypothetical protein n=1 Tax=Spirillospora sp. CA-294931 TaxID=3240042 RepID=UPI003D926951
MASPASVRAQPAASVRIGVSPSSRTVAGESVTCPTSWAIRVIDPGSRPASPAAGLPHRADDRHGLLQRRPRGNQ